MASALIDTLVADPALKGVSDLVALHPDLPKLLISLAGQDVNLELHKSLDLGYLNGEGIVRGRSVENPDGDDDDEDGGRVLRGADSYIRPNGEEYFARGWGAHQDVEVLRQARNHGLFPLLYGPPGTGKSAMAEAAFGTEMITVLGTGDTEVADLVGGYVQNITGGFDWVDGPLLVAAEQGRPILIDEIGIIDPKVLTVIYSFMDGRQEYFVTANPQRGTVKAMPGFFIIGATNPNAPGVRISEALISRFPLQVEVMTDYIMAQNKLKLNPKMVNVASNMAKKVSKDEADWAPQMRELIDFERLSRVYGEEFAIRNLLAAAPITDRPKLADQIQRVFGDEYVPARI